MKNNIDQLLELLLKAGQILLESGAETYRAETTVAHMYSSLGNGKIDVFALATTITVSIYQDGRHYSFTKRIRKRDIDLNKIEQVNAVSRQISRLELDVSTAMDMLNKIDSKTSQKKTVGYICFGRCRGNVCCFDGRRNFRFFHGRAVLLHRTFYKHLYQRNHGPFIYCKVFGRVLARLFIHNSASFYAGRQC